MINAVFSIDISKLLAELIILPIVLSEKAIALKASQVSRTKLKSLVGVILPKEISFLPDKI